MSDHREVIWSIIAARDETRRAPDGSRSLLQPTMDRARRLSGCERRILVVSGGHPRFEETGRSRGGPVIEEPRDCGTCAAVFLPATYVLVKDPDATVLLLPANHCVEPEEVFLRHLRSACRLAQRGNRLILLAARPRSVDTRYDWIVSSEPGVACNGQSALADVIRLHEKPTKAEALALYREGALWNTMIIAAKVKAIWALGWLHLPDMMRRFDMLRQVLHAIRYGRLPPAHESLALSHSYRGMEYADFSRDILAPSVGSLSAHVIEGVKWADSDGSGLVGRPAVTRDPLFRSLLSTRGRTAQGT